MRFDKLKLPRSSSNLRGKRLAAHRAGVFAKLLRPTDRLSREHQRAVAKLLSKAQRRGAAQIAQRVRHSYHASNLGLGADGRRWAGNVTRFRAQLRRELARALPNFGKWMELTKAYQRERRQIAKQAFAALVTDDVHVRFDDVMPADSGETYEFTSPYALFDTTIAPAADAEAEDSSVAIPSGGFLLNRIHFAQEYQPLIWTDIYGLTWPARHISTTSCGVNFTPPASGRLRLRATLQNYFSNIVLALRNQFGFSEGYLHVDLRVVFSILRPNQVIELSTTLVHDGYESPGGAEATYQLPPLDNSTPHVIEATTDEVFPANSAVQILAGTQIVIVSEIDDMNNYVDVNLGWKLQKIAIEIV